MIENDRPDSEVQKVLEKVRDRLMLGIADLSTDEYYRFCKHYGNACYCLGRIAEAGYFLRRAHSIAISIGDVEIIAESVTQLLAVFFSEHLFTEGIRLGEKFEAICAGCDGVYDIEEGLCILYSIVGWNRKAQRLADKILRYRRKTGTMGHIGLYCFLYSLSYNNGKCKDKEFLLSDWFDLECLVHGPESAAAMEVLSEKAKVIAHADDGRVNEAIMLLDETIPVLEKKGCAYSIIDLPRLIAYQAQLKNQVGETSAALKLFEKSKSLFSDPDEKDKEYLEFVDEEIARIESSIPSRSAQKGGIKDGSL